MPAEKQLAQARAEIAKSIKVKMIERNISQAELADMLHVSRPTINLAVSGGSADYLINIRKKIYKILGMEDTANE